MKRYAAVLPKLLELLHFEEITLVLLQCHYYAVQDRVKKKLKVIAETCKDELIRNGLDPEELLRVLNEK